ncbi:dinuclear metal center YbgI/SA1388 family protein [Natranaerovirga hydrolytica]|uniref:GTP cyclohydrolase 1 type 2 homolog n=1 Tax=Natranaerovirga hydrolytica TaxID=680378 RepID=A0A4R1N6P9_9FIRM|nr:Nif3-like dinuclear metal center hexameric protein [Natranaerovirga hydrolytica]TCK98709.1 dinuclear metal center YbgI/SA1388 family protein [Natranaerovirga hydrolytica]
MSIKTSDIIQYMEDLSPSQYAYEWDNVGLLIGEKDQTIEKILVALDATENVVEEAINKGVDMIITHHPMIFKGVKRITTQDFLGRKIIKMIKNDISLYAAHTNLDAVGSLSDLLANTLQLKQIELLNIKETKKLYKMVVFTPITHIEAVREAICAKGAGHIGDYSHCTYNSLGEGTFMPLEGTHPYIGTKNQLEKIEEIKLETIVKSKDLQKVTQGMLEAHPYEEVAYDIYPLENQGEQIGVGRIGYLEEAMTIEALAHLTKQKLKMDKLRIYGDVNKKVKKIAICPGKGLSFIKDAMKKNADIMITGDVDYHTAIDALQEGLPIIDAGHFGTEHIVVGYLANKLIEQFNSNSKNVEVIQSEEQNPYITL